MKCTYIIKEGSVLFDEQSYQYNTLYEFVSKNLNKFNSDNSITDIIFSLESEEIKNKMDRNSVLNLLKTAKKELRTIRSRISLNQEIYNTAASSQYIDVREIIETGHRVLDGKPYVTQFNESQLENQKRIALKDEIIKNNPQISEAELNTKADEELGKFIRKNKATEEAGYHIHTAINLYYSGNYNKEDLYRALQKTSSANYFTSLEQVQSIIDGLKHTTNQIYDTLEYKDNEKDDESKINFLVNYSIDSPIEGTDKKLYGTIDLLVLDKNGNAHIYLFKTSSKMYSLQPEVVLKKKDWYLAFYRQMLATKGINPANISLNIVPMEVFLNDDNKMESVRFDNLENRLLVLNKASGISSLVYGHGQIHNNVSAVVPNLFRTEFVQSTVKTEVIDVMSKFFSSKDYINSKNNNEILGFINKQVKHSTDPENTWEFEDKINHIIVKIKDPEPKEKNSEVYEKVKKYLQEKKNAREETAEQFINNLKKVVSGDLEPYKLVNSRSDAAGNININLDQYVNKDWEVLDFPALEEFGIVAIQNKLTSQVDLIGLTTSYNMNEPINLSLGNTLLGDHQKNYVVGNDILKATNGNIELIKVLSVINELSKNNSILQNLQIGDIKILNTNSGEAAFADINLLRKTFKQLCKNAQVKDNLDEIKWVNAFDILKNRFLSIVKATTNPQNTIHSLYSEFEKIDPFNEKAAVESLIQLAKTLEATYHYLSPNWNEMIKQSSMDTLEKKRIVNLYYLINLTIVKLNGNFYQPEEMKVVGDFTKDNFLNGRQFATPDAVKDRNIANLTSIVRETFTVIRKDFSDFQENFLHKTVKPFHKNKGYSQAENIIIGDQIKLYRNLFKEKDGKILPAMVFKNPYDPKEDLTPEERVFLKDVLWRINSRRFASELSGAGKDSAKAKQLQQSQKWFWVPLMKADLASRLTGDKIKDAVVQERKELVAKLSTIKERFKQNAEEIYTPEDEKQGNIANERYEMFNRFSRSEADEESRHSLLTSQPTNFWETNIENIVLHYEYAYIRKEVLDRVLPIAKAIRLVTEAYGDLASVKTKENVEYINNYLKQAAFNRTILSDEEKSFVGAISNARQLTSALMVAGNLVAPLRDVFQGFWKTIGVFVGDTWGEGKGFTKSDYMWAVKTMITDNIESFSGITLCEALNQRFGMANVDINVLVQRAKSGKAGICNFKDKLFWTATCGDYFNRMCILIAKMKHDGCFEACSYDEGFKYDWTRDKRFSEFAKNPNKDSQDAIYREQKGLYITMLREFNDNGYNLKYGDALPSPYAPLEITTIKTFADRMYGYYDHETRMQGEKTAIGAIALQFSTYLTASKTKWLLPKGQYNTNERIQRTDENGNPLYWKEDKDNNGNLIYIPTIENTGSPIMDVGSTYMEGILWTLVDAYEDFKNLGVKGMFQNIQDIAVKRQNLKSLGYTLLMWLFYGLVVKYLIELWKENREKDKSAYTLSKALGDGTVDIFTRAISGSFSEFSLITAFGGDILGSEPPMIGATTNLFTSSWDLVTGDKTLGGWLKTNVSAYRSIRKFAEGVGKIGEAAENSIEKEQI